MYTKGKDAIYKSFEKTISALPSAAKRVYIENDNINNIINNNNNSNISNNRHDDIDGKEDNSRDDNKAGNDNTVNQNDEISSVTFCLDFHRPGTAPGLGDKNKYTGMMIN